MFTLALTQPLVLQDPPWELPQSEQFLLVAARLVRNWEAPWEHLGWLVAQSSEQPGRLGVSWSFKGSGIVVGRVEAPTMHLTLAGPSRDSESRAST